MRLSLIYREVPLDSEDIIRHMAAAGFSITRSRRAVADAVAAQTCRFNAAAVEALAAEWAPGVGRATVFRTLDLLERIGVLGRIHAHSGCAEYVVCRRQGHHHHLVCSACGNVTEVPGCGLGAMLEDAVEQFGFRVDGHLVEIYGQCPSCRRQSGSELPSPHIEDQEGGSQ